jgi:hypothetical protein
MTAPPVSVTSVPWPRTLYQYGAVDTYRLAAEWLKDCATVADWGGAQGYFGTCLPSSVQYTLVDGTVQAAQQTLADLCAYRQPSDGILLRHVLDNTHDWQPILANALQAFRHRMVIVTYTPDADITRRVERKNGWPEWRFNPDDLRRAMGHVLVRDEAVETTHPERVYYLERAC